jgi:hypothetical protein
VTNVAGSIGASWIQPGAALANNLARGNWVIQPNLSAAQTAGPSRRQGLPEEAPRIPQATGYMYLPGYRPSAQPGAQFWLPDLPDGQQFWVPTNMVASGEDYRDPDWLNNPQYDPQNPEGSLARMIEVYGPLQPVPPHLLRMEAAYLGKGARTSYDQPRTILTGRRALGVNPYGLAGAEGMYQTQGAPDPLTQPELYAQWEQAVMAPRGEYGIWMESPIDATPNATFQQTGTGLSWQTKPRTPVTVTAPGQVIAVTDTPQYGKVVIVQHDFGQTVYSGLISAGAVEGQYLATGDLVGLSGENFTLGMQLGGEEGWTDPQPYLPSTGERGESGWSLLDVPGISRQKAMVLVDMGYRTPEDLRDRGTPAALDQHPLFGQAFDAQEGWNIMSAVNALLASGPNPNPPVSGDYARIPPSQRPAISAAGQPAELPETPEGSAPVATRAGAPGGRAYAASDAQIASFAAENQIDPALMQAVLNVESGGQGLNADGSLKIRLEVAQLFRYADSPEIRERFRSKGNYNEQYLAADGTWKDVHASQANEQEAYALAVELAGKDAASNAISMGAPQIMGFHAEKLGYESPGAMYDAFASGQSTQIAGFLDLVNGDARMMNALRTGDIAAFANAYNPGAKTLYTERMTNQYNALTAGAAAGTAAGTAANVVSGGGDTVTPPSGVPLMPGMLPGLTSTRLNNLHDRSDIATVEAIAKLRPGEGDEPSADEKWLGKMLGTSDLDIIRGMIHSARGYAPPGPTTSIMAHPYLFASDMQNPITGTNITEAELRHIMLEGKARTFADLAAADPKQLMRDAKITRSQADAAIETARRYAPDIEPNSRVLPRSYAEIPPPPPSGPELYEEMFKGLSLERIEALAAAGITTLGQLRQIGKPPVAPAEGEPTVSWSPDWVRANAGNGITVDVIKTLVERADAYAVAPPISPQTSIVSQKEALGGLSFDTMMEMARKGIYDLGDLARTDTHWLRDNIEGIGVKTALQAVQGARQLSGLRMATEAEKLLYRTGGVPVPADILLETDPSRTETRYPFRYEQPGTGVKGISAAREELLYGTAPTRALAGSGEVIDTPEEFVNADVDWLYEASGFKWNIEEINAAQNALRERLKLPLQTLGDSHYAKTAQQDLTTLGITQEQVKQLQALGITDYGSLQAAPDDKTGAIGAILQYDPSQVEALKKQVGAQMQAIQEQIESEEAAPVPEAEPTPEAGASSPYIEAAAAFLGVDPAELASLAPDKIKEKMDDRMSLYNQPQRGSGAQDAALRAFTRQYDMGVNSLDVVAARTAAVTDRRQNIRMDAPTASHRSPTLAAGGADMRQIETMVRRIVGDMEPRFASRIYRQLEQSLYA